MRLVLAGEDPATITRQETDRRILQLYAQLRAKASTWWNLEAGADHVAAARRVFAYYPAEELARPG